MAQSANVMEPSAMKVLLAKSKEEPVRAAIGLGKDGGGKMLLHKSKAGMALGKQLESESPGLKDMRFGVALVDVEQDPKLVRLVVNRPVSGLARRLKRTLKGTGYTKIVIGLEDGTVLDQALGEDEEDEEGASESAAPPPPPPPVDVKLLTLTLSAQVQRMRGILAAAPGRKDALMALASAAQEAIKAGDAGRAGTAIAALEEALAAAPPATPEAAPPSAPAAGNVAFQKMRLLWDGTRKALSDQLKALEAEIVAASDDEPDAKEIAANVGKLEHALQTLDTRLSDALDALYNQGGTDPALKREAKDIALSYQGFVETDPLLTELDANPFMPLDAAKRVQTALNSMISRL